MNLSNYSDFLSIVLSLSLSKFTLLILFYLSKSPSIISFLPILLSFFFLLFLSLLSSFLTLSYISNSTNLHSSKFKENIDIKSTSGWSINLIAFERYSTLSWDIGIGAGPSPFWCILSPQKNWSPKNGTMVVGHWIHNIDV